jgi:uncharacterized protein YkwD
MPDRRDMCTTDRPTLAPYAPSMFTKTPRRQPRRIMARAIALSGTALLAAALIAWTPQPTTGWDQSSAEATLWQLLNGDRTNNGLAPLGNHSTLVSLARWRSQDMVDRDYFNHTVLGTGYQVYHWYDTNGLSWSSGGENIGWNVGYSDADSPININQGFMDSPGHRANIMNSAWTHGGVGAYGADGVTWGGQVRNMRMYTELFIQLKSAAPPPPPPPTPPPPTPKPVVVVPKPVVVTPVPVPVATPPPVPVETATPTPEPTAAPKVVRNLARMLAMLAEENSAPASHAIVAHSMRVETAAAPDRGIFETVIGSLLSFFLG